MRKITRIVIHHSASSLATTKEDIDKWHKSRGWSGCGYNFVIEGDGKLVLGRPLERVPAQARGYNTNSIGICLVGDNTDLEQRWSMLQIYTLEQTLPVLKTMFPDAIVLGHKDLPDTSTECPGLDIRELLGLPKL